MTEAGAARLKVLRYELEASLQPVETAHAGKLQCRRGCSGCCVDDLTVFSVEAEAIRRFAPRLLREGRPHPPGACAFLDGGGACRIHPVRPYVCRTQGLPLRWWDDDGTEFRDICPLNADAVDLLGLDGRDCWTLGPFEGRLAQLQAETAGRAPTPADRVRLRDLFEQA